MMLAERQPATDILAAPPLVRAIFRLPTPGAPRRLRPIITKEVAAK